jgi:predicted HAD superfamily phosphohydrolase YqeG
MVGDQYLTDIAGAGMAGVRSIKIDAIAPSTFPMSLRAAQRAERVLYSLRHGRPSLPVEPRPSRT